MNDQIPLYEALSRHGKLPDKEWLYFKEQLTPAHFDRGTFLVLSGDPPGDFHFIVTGLVQLSYPSSLGHKVIKDIANEGDMTGPLLDWLASNKSSVDIQALEATETLAFPSAMLTELLKRDAAWEKIVRGYIAELARKTEHRALNFLALSPEQRYLKFMDEKSDLCRRLTLNQIAAYLGITDVSLSRIRKRLNNR
jgi:CRP-like cAMP-binding protein